MLIRAKDLAKTWGTALLTFGATGLTALFWNYCADLKDVARPNDAALNIIYDAQITTSKVVCACAGGILGLITLVTLSFWVYNFVDKNRQTIGVLKALGYGAGRISANFLLFFAPVMCGSVSGFAFAMGIAQPFYNSMTDYDALLPTLSFRWEICVCIVLLPAAAFGVAAALTAFCKLRRPALDLIKDVRKTKARKGLDRIRTKDLPFLITLRKSVARNNLLTYVFVAIASWGFSAMVQMSFTMTQIDMSPIAPALCAPIGVMMGVVMLLLALQSTFAANKQYLALMQAFGYEKRSCASALLGGYRPVAFFGFALGAPYQYGIMYIAVGLFGGAYDVSLSFSWLGLGVTTCAFILFYEGFTALYRRRIFRLSAKTALAYQ
ncbi:MAG: hypothetical protein NC132_06365 [Corallococcus sp.]|nr:hypothetical protein [Corallococcus sp.]MCM1359767.1 hypothetical protein [Corallococcus sp.]MCM1395707.1 hypothetical protein [Corallococcus sp.]